ncbi:MAG: twitching motility protein [Desulforhopalus sp.]
MELNKNQSALILTADDQGEINVDVASGDHNSLTAAICTALAKKLMGDPEFQKEIMEMIDSEDGE